MPPWHLLSQSWWEEGMLADCRTGGREERSRSTFRSRGRCSSQVGTSSFQISAPGAPLVPVSFSMRIFRIGINQKTDYRNESRGVKLKRRWGLAIAGSYLWPWVRRRLGGGTFTGSLSGRGNQGSLCSRIWKHRGDGTAAEDIRVAEKEKCP